MAQKWRSLMLLVEVVGARNLPINIFIYRNKNLYFNLDLYTLSLLSLRLNLNLRNPKPFKC